MLQDIIKKLHAYFRRLLFPLYLFPIKLLTYSLYYTLRAIGRFTWALLLILRDMVIFPFLSLRNLLKTLFLLTLILYVFASLVVIADYFTKEYANYSKFFCSLRNEDELKSKVVRIVGGLAEGTGFFIQDDQVLTNFHVIDGESSPKVILPGGDFITPDSIVGDKDLDLAILTFESESYASYVLPLPTSQISLFPEEKLYAVGYPLGTDLVGDATLLKGRFIDFRTSSSERAVYLQTDINVVKGMSGGPLTDICGQVVGINTIGLAGLSLFIDGFQASQEIANFSAQDVALIEVDASLSPEDGVKAFYTYIMARDLQNGFALLSSEYLHYTTYAEWTSRFHDILSIDVVLTQLVEDEPDTVFVKFITKTWTGSEVNYKYYEGIWVTKLEDGLYKMRRSLIKEVSDPPWDWYYPGPEY